MATKRKRKRAKPPQAVAMPGPDLVPAPAFWFGFEVTWAKLALARTVVFAILAIDAIAAVATAPHHGGFGVAQLPGFDAFAPSRTIYELGQLALAYMFVLAAFGVATRVVVPIATMIYAVFFLGSQLDASQSHYLVALVLVLACFVPWQRPKGAAADTLVRSWALRLVLVQLAIIYGWSAIAQLDPAWMNGHTLAQLGHPTASAVIANVMIACEVALAATVWWKRRWSIAAPIGIVLHAGTLALGIDAGLFPWLMLALYILIVPDRAWVWLATKLPAIPLARLPASAALAAFIAGFVAAAVCRFDHALALAIVASVVFAGASLTRRENLRVFAIAHAVALFAWLAVDRTSSIAADYYAQWGTSARRANNPDDAETAYRRLTEIAPDDATAHYQLGRLLIARGIDGDGTGELHEAQRLEPTRARAWLDEACVAARRGDHDGAIAKARFGVEAEPASAPAKALVAALGRPGVPPACANLER